MLMVIPANQRHLVLSNPIAPFLGIWSKGGNEMHNSGPRFALAFQGQGGLRRTHNRWGATTPAQQVSNTNGK
jgi:hypothetical protein